MDFFNKRDKAVGKVVSKYEYVLSVLKPFYEPNNEYTLPQSQGVLSLAIADDCVMISVLDQENYDRIVNEINNKFQEEKHLIKVVLAS